MRKTKSWSRNCSSAKPCFTCSGDKTKGALWRLALMRTPVLGPRFPPAPTGIPDELDCGHNMSATAKVGLAVNFSGDALVVEVVLPNSNCFREARVVLSPRFWPASR